MHRILIIHFVFLFASWTVSSLKEMTIQIHIGCPELVFSNHYLYKLIYNKEKSFNQSFIFVLSENSMGNFILTDFDGEEKMRWRPLSE